MPNRYIFHIRAIRALIEKYIRRGGKWIDPFTGKSPFKKRCLATNDLNPELKATYHLEALEFLDLFEDDSVDGVLFDPPFSARQIKESYGGIGLEYYQPDGAPSDRFYSLRKDEVTRVLRPGGITVSLGWNSNGMGKSRGFKTLEILLVAHGGWHNDTICVVERKMNQSIMEYLRSGCIVSVS